MKSNKKMKVPVFENKIFCWICNTWDKIPEQWSNMHMHSKEFCEATNQTHEPYTIENLKKYYRDISKD